MNIRMVSENRNFYGGLINPAKTKASNWAKNDFKNVIAEETFENTSAVEISENADKEAVNISSDDLYNAIDERAVASKEDIEKQRLKFWDMYVPASTARKYYNPSLVGLPNDHVSFEECGSKKAGDLEMKGWRNADRADCIIVPLGGGELPQFMDYVLNSLENGISLEQILQNHLDKQPLINGELLGQRNNDWFLVNPSNGDVMCALKGGRVQTGSVASDEVIDREAVYELADDLNTFLRYAAFPQEEDDPEKVKELFSYIKNKQAYANFERFLADGEKGVADSILEALTAAGVLKGDDEEEEAVDGLMETIRVHEEELREKRIDLEESERSVREIWEIIGGEIKDYGRVTV